MQDIVIIRSFNLHSYHAGSCWLVLARAGSCWLMLAHAGSCWLLLAPAGSCWLMLAHAGSCWLMLAHAGSCWLMLAHTGSCACLRVDMGTGNLRKYNSCSFLGVAIGFALYLTSTYSLAWPDKRARSIKSK